MEQPVIPDEFELVEWPTVEYGPELTLDMAPADEVSHLRELMPPPEQSAWETAKVLLEWTTTRWAHANQHVERESAIEVLDRVAGGERFACVEYAIVLGQALNAADIPARRLRLRMADAHVGFGRGHVVTEAWIDDLGKWVVLDGQNGAWWGTADCPLGFRELSALWHQEAEAPDMLTGARPARRSDTALWWQYFASANIPGMAWGPTVCSRFQSEPVTTPLLVDPLAVTHPDLSRVTTGLQGYGGVPAVAFRPAHPYASGVLANDFLLAPGEPLSLADAFTGGSESVDVCATTRYGKLRPHRLRRAHRP
jgi:hypothetical protein